MFLEELAECAPAGLQILNLKIHKFLFEGNTPLITAAEYGHAPIVEYLIQNNANLNAQNTDGKIL